MSHAVSTSLGTRIVAAALTRLHGGEPITADFVLLAAHPLLANLAPRIDAAQRHWRLATATGEVTLRAALRAEPEPLVAVLPADARLPHDVVDRAYLRRIERLQAEDVVAAAGRRDCEPVRDHDLVAAVFRHALQLEALLDNSSLGPRLRVADVRALVLAAELGSPLRLTQRSPEAWLADWVVQGAPKPQNPAMLAQALGEAHGRHGEALAWAVQQGVENLLTQGALCGSDKGRKLLPSVPPPPELEPRELAALVERAVNLADEIARGKTDDGLRTAEALAHRSRWSLADAAMHPLLLATLDQALATVGHALGQGQAPADAELANLSAHRAAKQRTAALGMARAAARVRRGVDALQLSVTSADWRSWFAPAVDLGWLDLAIRELRGHLLLGAGPVSAGAQVVADAAIQWRSEWNRGFAAALASNWPAVTGANDPAGPLALHHVGRSLVRPLLDAGQKVYLAVLDGCDLATALDLLRGLGEQGLAPVRMTAAPDALGEAIRSRRPVEIGISLVPTITSHARRALMLGAIPGAQQLDQAENPTSNATSDRTALQQNTALGQYPRRLFLKPDLQNQAEALRQLLANPGDVRLAVAVWNGVDDALASHETGPFGRWKFEDLGAGAIDTLQQAVASGWTVLLAADHGHTPYLSNDRKVLPSADGGRFHSQPTPGSVLFDRGPLPMPAIHALVDVGAWHGPQRKGFHGGAGFEEVAVPLFALGQSHGAQGLQLPAWWFGGDRAAPVPLALLSAPAPAVATPMRSQVLEPSSLGVVAAAPAPAVVAAAASPGFAGLGPREAKAVALLREKSPLTAPQLARLLGIPAFLVQGMMATVLRQWTVDAGAAPFDVRDQDGEVVYTWLGHDRG